MPTASIIRPRIHRAELLEAKPIIMNTTPSTKPIWNAIFLFILFSSLPKHLHLLLGFLEAISATRVLLPFQPSQPLPGVLDFSCPRVSVLSEGEEFLVLLYGFASIVIACDISMCVRNI
jgi:hypothetical protein